MRERSMWLQFHSRLPQLQLTHIGRELYPIGGINDARGMTTYGCEVVIANIFDQRLEYVFKCLNKHGIGGFIRYGGQEVSVSTWDETPGDEWLAGYLTYGYRHSSLRNPVEDYAVYLPGLPPTPGDPGGVGHGYLADGKPVIMSEKPKGRLARVCRDLIFESRFIEILGGDEAGAWNGDVVWRNKIMKSWRRLRPYHHCNIIAPESFLPPLSCIACGQETVLPTSFWIAKDGATFGDDFAEDEIGYNCKRLMHPLVVSVEKTIEINRCFRGYGYAIEPILRRDGPTAQKVFEIVDRAKLLVDRDASA